jgi:polyhydroxyalkanoate synthase
MLDDVNPAGLDTPAFGKALAAVAPGLAAHPGATVDALRRYASTMRSVVGSAASVAVGGSSTPPTPADPKDRRFADRAWSENALYFGLQQAYLAATRLGSDLVDAAGLDSSRSEKARFALRLVADALSPSNLLVTNPTALKRAFDTGGHSVVRGVSRLLSDLRDNNGMPSQVDRSGFRVGQNLAATPGLVVFRNDLMELIQYAPRTDTVHEVPLLCSPPWINKYYVMDLAPGRSFVQWAVDNGHTVFAISYRNPDDSMRAVTLDDYLREGPLTALDIIEDITGSPRVNLAGLCLGGTLTAMLLAYLAARQEDRVASATLLNTLVDFTDPGALAVFTDANAVDRLERRMAARGFLGGSEMAGTFNVLRANDLIFNYLVSGWLMGEDPPAFDILSWNADTTRMPAQMHAFYLRSCYVHNLFARGELDLAGVRLDLSKVGQDMYVLGAENDHITPWTGSYRTTQLVGGTVRYVLSSAGHIAGIVNPPSPKARHWTNDALPEDPLAWRSEATARSGSWWEDWVDWVTPRSGPRREPPAMGSAAYPPLGNAPGQYVYQS